MTKSAALRKYEIKRAKTIAVSLGIYTAAKYLSNRNWSIEAALYILLGK